MSPRTIIAPVLAAALGAACGWALRPPITQSPEPLPASPPHPVEVGKLDADLLEAWLEDVLNPPEDPDTDQAWFDLYYGRFQKEARPALEDLAARDADLALEALARIPEGLQREATAAVAAGFARNSVDFALRWARSLESPKMRDGALHGLLPRLASMDIDRALRLRDEYNDVMSFPMGTILDAALESDPARAFAIVEESAQQGYIDPKTSDWFRDHCVHHPELAFPLVAQLGGLSGSNLLVGLQPNVRREFAEYLARVSTRESAPPALISLVEHWPRVDPSGVLRWLGADWELPPALHSEFHAAASEKILDSPYLSGYAPKYRDAALLQMLDRPNPDGATLAELLVRAAPDEASAGEMRHRIDALREEENP